MNTFWRTLLAAALVAGTPFLSYAATPTDKPYNQERAEQNLLIGVASDNMGLRLSAASILAEVGSERSVVPLMALLHNGCEEERIVAALALSKIPDARGEFAVRRTAMFDPSPRVQRMAAWYFNQYVVPKPDAIAPVFSSLNWSGIVTPYPEDYDGADTAPGVLSH